MMTEEPAYVMYGPYSDLPEGHYKLEVKYEYIGNNEEDETHKRIGLLDMNGSVEELCNRKIIIYADQNMAEMEFDLLETCFGFELRLFAEKSGIRPISVKMEYSKKE